MKEIVTADKQRDRAAISGPTRGIDNMVTERLQQMVMEAGEETSNLEEESTMAASPPAALPLHRAVALRG